MDIASMLDHVVAFGKHVGWAAITASSLPWCCRAPTLMLRQTASLMAISRPSVAPEGVERKGAARTGTGSARNEARRGHRVAGSVLLSCFSRGARDRSGRSDHPGGGLDLHLLDRERPDDLPAERGAGALGATNCY